jgi:hypothetical protein
MDVAQNSAAIEAIEVDSDALFDLGVVNFVKEKMVG